MRLVLSVFMLIRSLPLPKTQLTNVGRINLHRHLPPLPTDDLPLSQVFVHLPKLSANILRIRCVGHRLDPHDLGGPAYQRVRKLSPCACVGAEITCYPPDLVVCVLGAWDRVNQLGNLCPNLSDRWREFARCHEPTNSLTCCCNVHISQHLMPDGNSVLPKLNTSRIRLLDDFQQLDNIDTLHHKIPA